jgi:Domain of Unknown Function (DUF1080)
MRSHNFFRLSLLCLGIFLSLLSSSVSWADNATGWKSLFNGQDLSGWKAIDGSKWHVENGILTCNSGGQGWLATTEEYKNFELELEFRLPAGGNSGVFLRSPETGTAAWDGMEIQVLDDDAPEYAKIETWQHSGSLYGLVAAKLGALKKAGEWQKYFILCDGRHVKVTLNGTVVVDANLADFIDGKTPPLDGKAHPGIQRAQGVIGLQSHGTGIEYRNLRIHALP